MHVACLSSCCTMQDTLQNSVLTFGFAAKLHTVLGFTLSNEGRLRSLGQVPCSPLGVTVLATHMIIGMQHQGRLIRRNVCVLIHLSIRLHERRDINTVIPVPLRYAE